MCGGCSAVLEVVSASPSEVTWLGLLLLRLLGWAWSHRGDWLRPVPVEAYRFRAALAKVTGLDLFQWM